MVAAFNDHPQVIVLPNAKDTLQVKDVNGEKVSVRKVLTQVGRACQLEAVISLENT